MGFCNSYGLKKTPSAKGIADSRFTKDYEYLLRTDIIT